MHSTADRQSSVIGCIETGHCEGLILDFASPAFPPALRSG